jgi:hypothetical protein
LLVNLYFLFILSNFYDILKIKNNNTKDINNSIINKNSIIKKYEDKIDNKFCSDEFKYFLEESMIIID